MAGAAAEAGARMRRGADVVEIADRGRVVAAVGERPEQEELVDRAGAAVRLAADEVDVERLEVGRRVGAARENRLGEAVDVAGENRLDPVGVRLAQRFGPAAVGGDVDLAGGVALHLARRLGELHPQDRRALRAARRIDRRRLADADRRLGREQAADAFVGGTRDAI